MSRLLIYASSARAIVLLLYLAAFAVGIAMLLFDAQLQEGFKSADFITQLSSVYAVPLSIAVAGVAAKPPAPEKERLTPAQLVLLYGSTLLWNAFVIAVLIMHQRGLSIASGLAPVPDSALLADFGLAKDKLSFLVAGILTYVYGAQKDANTADAA